jgi:hypothetical protein
MIKGLLFLAAGAGFSPLANGALAAEQTFHRGTQWEVVLVDTYAATKEAPYCAIRSTAWTSKYVSYEAPLLGIDKTGEALRVHKSGWKLPVGDTTPVLVGLTSFPLNAELMAKAIDEDVLYATVDADSPTERSFMFGEIINQVFNEAKTASMAVRFKGNEKLWVIDKIDGFQAYRIKSTYADCKSALIALGPTIFGDKADASSTSPFGEKGETTEWFEGANEEPTAKAKYSMEWFLKEGGGSANYSGMQTGSDK